MAAAFDSDDSTQRGSNVRLSPGRWGVFHCRGPQPFDLDQGRPSAFTGYGSGCSGIHAKDYLKEHQPGFTDQWSMAAAV